MNDARLGIVRLPLGDDRTVPLQLTFEVLDGRGHAWFLEQLTLLQKGRAASATARAELLEAMSGGAVTADEVRTAPVAAYPIAPTIAAIWSAWELAQYGPQGRPAKEGAANPPKARPTLWDRLFKQR